MPYTPWESGGARHLPDPQAGRIAGPLTSIPETTRQLVTAHLRELTDSKKLRDEDRLAEDLGIDSIAKAELVLWLSREFGFSDGEVDALQTVGDVLLATRGEAVVNKAVELEPIPPAWFRGHSGQRVDAAAGRDDHRGLPRPGPPKPAPARHRRPAQRGPGRTAT